MNWSVEDIYQQLMHLDEHSRIEAKRASAIGHSIMQTVCAFANEPGLGGGWLVLGVCEPDKTHETRWIEGVSNIDQLLGDLQNNCRTQFEHPIHIQSKQAFITGKLVVVVFIPELEPAAKPCRFIGKPGKPYKCKTGVWRRGTNNDYECTEHEVEPLLLAKSGLRYEQTVLPDAQWSDIDPALIVLCRQLRGNVKPHAEELQGNDESLLQALNAIKKRDGEYRPTIAGLLLFGKPLSLRRLLPALRVDYVRVNGTEWVEDPQQRFTATLDLREPLLRLLLRLEATILDDMPQHFKLEEGQTQRSDHPLLPQKVVREAVVNALMHRDYHVNEPILVVRYRNRLEIRNPGYSLKPETELGKMGSRQRNPDIAAVMYDLQFAETKGSGIATMRKLLLKVGLTEPLFVSSIAHNQFTATYFLHQFLSEENLQWLQRFHNVDIELTTHEKKALILLKETGAIDNAALRNITGLDTLSASRVLSHLSQQHQLIKKGGSGPKTYYHPSEQLRRHMNTNGLPTNAGDLSSNTGDLPQNTGDLSSNAGDLSSNAGDLTLELQSAITALTPKARKLELWPVILGLCAQQPQRAEQLARYLNRKEKQLKSKHLQPMRKEGLIDYVYPEVLNHPAQAYQITVKGREQLSLKK